MAPSTLPFNVIYGRPQGPNGWLLGLRGNSRFFQSIRSKSVDVKCHQPHTRIFSASTFTLYQTLMGLIKKVAIWVHIIKLQHPQVQPLLQEGIGIDLGFDSVTMMASVASMEDAHPQVHHPSRSRLAVQCITLSITIQVYLFRDYHFSKRGCLLIF